MRVPITTDMPARGGEAGGGDSLRSEIVESQKSQADFLKWKLVSVAAVSSVSLGLAGPQGTVGDGAKYLLCLVPLICAYVDLISLHIMIRIVTIGLYLKLSGDVYERFAFEVRDRTDTNPYVFEAVALHGSSLIFNIIMVALGFALPQTWDRSVLNAYLVAGFVGIVVTLFSWVMYKFRADKVKSTAEQVFAALRRDNA